MCMFEQQPRDLVCVPFLKSHSFKLYWFLNTFPLKTKSTFTFHNLESQIPFRAGVCPESEQSFFIAKRISRLSPSCSESEISWGNWSNSESKLLFAHFLFKEFCLTCYWIISTLLISSLDTGRCSAFKEERTQCKVNAQTNGLLVLQGGLTDRCCGLCAR